MVSRQPFLVGAHSRQGLPWRAPWSGGVILVFGGGGQLGQELARMAVQRRVALATLTHAQADIGDRAAVAAALDEHRPSLVVNAAAYTNVDRAETETSAAFAANALGPAVLADACADAQLPLLH